MLTGESACTTTWRPRLDCDEGHRQAGYDVSPAAAAGCMGRGVWSRGAPGDSGERKRRLSTAFVGS